MIPGHLGFAGQRPADDASSDLEKARLSDEDPRAREARELAAGPPRGIFTDPETTILRGGYGRGEYLLRPSHLNHAVLRRMTAVTPVAAIMNVMESALAEFSVPQDNPRLPGFAVRLRDREANATRAAKREMAEKERFFRECGYGYADEHDRPDLEGFVKRTFRDSFAYDQAPVQLVPSEAEARSRGFDGTVGAGLRRAPKASKPYEPAEFLPMAGESMRLATPPDDGGKHPDDAGAVLRYVQVDSHDLPVEAFTRDELVWTVRHPRNDLAVAGYGYSECEMLVDALGAWLHPWNYNKSFFRQGAQTKGLLNLVSDKEAGPPPVEMREAFQRDFKSMVSGPQNAHRVPLIWGGEARWVSLSGTNRDLEFAEWMNFVTKWLCAICLIDPAEVNFVFGNTGQSGSLGGDNTRAKTDVSRSRWLRPHVRHLFKVLNKILRRLPNGEDFVIAPAGVDVESEGDRLDRIIKLVGHVQTVDEARAELDLDALGEGKGGDLILNQTYLQGIQAMQGGGDGAPGADGPPGADDPDDDDGADDDEGAALASRLLNAKPGKAARKPKGKAPSGRQPSGDADDAQKSVDALHDRFDRLEGLVKSLADSKPAGPERPHEPARQVRAFNLDL